MDYKYHVYVVIEGVSHRVKQTDILGIARLKSIGWRRRGYKTKILDYYAMKIVA